MSETGRVLLADDEPAFQRVGGAWLRGLGHDVILAHDGASALARLADSAPDIVLLDLVMPPSLTPEAGLAMVPKFAPLPVIVLTGHADHEYALRAAEAGAWDFLAKPVDPDMLRFVAGRAIRQRRLEQELLALKAVQDAGNLGLEGNAPALLRLRDLVRRLGPTDVSVVILGPTGTGKELVARALHRASRRAAGPFVTVHCGALAGELLESELFGHVRGAFTGAHRDQVGLIETAHRGTLFLDEVGEMPAAMQVKLLRFLQEGTFVPVGARSERRADARVVAATHRNLEAMVATGHFREDLYYRLKGVLVRTPSLAERPEDVLLLATGFLRAAAPGLRFAADVSAYLAGRGWPGNVRELRAIVEAAAALAVPGAAEIDSAQLRFAAGEKLPDATPIPMPTSPSLNDAIAALETRMISETMSACGGNQSEAARQLGISRLGLIKKLARLGLRTS
jgi:two-component system NtrC family response regulator